MNIGEVGVGGWGLGGGVDIFIKWIQGQASSEIFPSLQLMVNIQLVK